MSVMMEYKCPFCGGAMEFDSTIQKMKCPYCDSEMTVEEFQRQQKQSETVQDSTAEKSGWQAASDGQWSAGETDGMRVYACESCGGEIVADETTGATSCPFCGNRVVMKGQFAGDLKPDCIIPFQMDKKAAKNAYYQHLKGKPFLPKPFKDKNHIDEIKGVYVPFWLYSAETNTSVVFHADRLRIWESGDTEYTEHSEYQVERSGRNRFEHLPVDGSRKMDDALMESIEPYDFSGAVPFEPAYMAGYLADRYDMDQNEQFSRATERINRSAEQALAQTVEGYNSVSVSSSQVDILNASYLYALYPVWILNTTWQNSKYIFAMNGQTGKMVGDLPVDKQAFWKYVIIRAAIITAILFALMTGLFS